MLKAFCFGMTIAAAIGPIALLIVNYSMAHGLRHGLRSALGAAGADFSYALVAFLAGHRAARLVEARWFLEVVAGIGLVLFGAWLAVVALRRRVPVGPSVAASGARVRPLLTTYMLTLINPLTLVAFLGLAPQLPLGGSSWNAAGLAGALFAGSLVVQSLLALAGAGLGRSVTRPEVIRTLNVASGIGIALFGIVGVGHVVGG
jgi:threonine/homoserine/homoserine lactone efflux protein